MGHDFFNFLIVLYDFKHIRKDFLLDLPSTENVNFIWPDLFDRIHEIHFLIGDDDFWRREVMGRAG